MGGAIGMVAASPLGPVALQARIQSLLLNDMAPELEQVAIDRIRIGSGTGCLQRLGISGRLR